MAGWLVTGGSGFLGSHALRALAAAGLEATALGRRALPAGTAARFVKADLDDPTSLRDAVEGVRPSVVLHLAGRTPPAEHDALYRSNTLATIHLLDALRAWGQPIRVVLAGSAAELGPVDAADLPVGEDHPCRPVEAYGLSKLLATTAGLAARPPLEVMSARVFNPIGPGLPASQAFGRFAACLRGGGSDPLTLHVGDLGARRDFVDVRDVARAFIAIAEHGWPGLVYHVGTGRSRRVGEGLERLIRLSGREVRIATNPELARRAGPSDSRADVARLAGHTGWRPEVPWEESLRDLWEAARPPDPIVAA